MLKNASELQKIALLDRFKTGFEDAKKGAIELATKFGTEFAMAQPADSWVDMAKGWSDKQYPTYQSMFPQLKNVDYSDFNAAMKAYKDPTYHSTFFPNLDINKKHTLEDVTNSFKGGNYIKGQGAWAYNNINRINNLRSYGKSPISSMLFGDYDKMRSNMYMMDQYGKEGTAENKFLKGYITPEQYKSYQRWRPLMAIWMNIRGWLRSLFQGGNFKAMSVSHPYQQNPTPAPAYAGA